MCDKTQITLRQPRRHQRTPQAAHPVSIVVIALPAEARRTARGRGGADTRLNPAVLTVLWMPALRSCADDPSGARNERAE